MVGWIDAPSGNSVGLRTGVLMYYARLLFGSACVICLFVVFGCPQLLCCWIGWFLLLFVAVPSARFRGRYRMVLCACMPKRVGVFGLDRVLVVRRSMHARTPDRAKGTCFCVDCGHGGWQGRQERRLANARMRSM